MPRNRSTLAGPILLAPETILQSRYRVVRHLGKGGMGVVYEAVDLRLGHTVALKQTLTSDEGLWKLFEREARLLARLNHPLLPRVTDYFTEVNRAFFVMQFVEGADLAEIILQQPGPFPRNAVVAWADQLLDALIYLHSQERQIIHRDIKPRNLKLTPSGQIALLDFGLAKSNDADSGEDHSVNVFGYTPRYAPLEQIQDLETGPQSDIYALGATLYHLLTGVKPPDALTRASALKSSKPNPLKSADEINAAVGPELTAILNRAMAQDPNDRFVSAAEFREALRRVGRIDIATEVKFRVRPDAFDLNVELGDMTLVRRVEAGSTRRLAPHAIAALFVILFAAFGVFCRYYPWKLPPASAPGVADPRTAVGLSSSQEARDNEDRANRALGSSNQKSAVSNRK